MTDSTLNRFNAQGTNAQRLAFTPSPPTPSSGPSQGYLWFETDTLDTYAYDGSAWHKVNNSSGSVTTTGSPASGNLAKFSGAASVTSGDLSGDVATSGTLATTIANDAVTFAKMQNATATKRLVGRNTASTGDYEEVTVEQLFAWIAGTPAQGDIFYRDGTAVARLPAGTSGQFLKTQGAGANPVWATAGVGWTAITPVSPSAAASVDFTGLSSYNELIIVARALTASVSGVRRVLVSTDNGVSFDTTAASYQGVTTTGVEANTATPAIGFHSTNSTAARTLIVHLKNTKGAVKLATDLQNNNILYVGSASDINAVRVDNHTGGTISGGPVYVFAR